MAGRLIFIVPSEIDLFDSGLPAVFGGEGAEGLAALVEGEAFAELFAEILEGGDDGGFEFGDLDEVEGVFVGDHGTDLALAHGEDHRFEVVAGTVESNPAEVDFAGFLLGLAFGDFLEVAAFKGVFADEAHAFEEADGVLVAIEEFHEVQAAGLGDGAVVVAVFVVKRAEFPVGGVGEVLGELGEELFHAEVGFAFVAELIALGFEHVPAGAMFAVGLEGLLKAFADLLVRDLGVELFGFLGDDDGVDDLLLGLLHELAVAFAAGDLEAGFGFGFDAGEGLLDQVRVDEFAVDADHAGRVAVNLGGARDLCGRGVRARGRPVDRNFDAPMERGFRACGRAVDRNVDAPVANGCDWRARGGGRRWGGVPVPWNRGGGW